MSGFVYRWTNKINGKWYIGSHKGTTDDGYRHTSEVVKLAETKYGLDNFVREILYEGDNYKGIEGLYLRALDAANDEMSYNRTSITRPNCFSKESREKLTKFNREK